VEEEGVIEVYCRICRIKREDDCCLQAVEDALIGASYYLECYRVCGFV